MQPDQTADPRALSPRLVLVGMMGCGKTTVGRLLADRTGWPYADNDDLVRATSGHESAAIRATDGEDALHAYESAALLDALGMSVPRVIGAAAWSVEDPVASALLQDHDGVVWLRARPETLRARIGSGAGRRKEATDLDWLRQQAAAREALYAGVADLVIDVDDLTPEAVADDILRWWRAVDRA